MTQAPPRNRSAAPDRTSGAPALQLPFVAAGRLALRTTALGLLSVEVVTLLLWAAEPHSGSGAGSALRTGVAFWLAAQHTGLHVGEGQIGLVPYGLTMLPVTLLWRGGRRVGRGMGRAEVLSWTGTIAGLYGALSALLCLAARSDTVRPIAGQALAGGAVVAALAAGAGAWRSSRWRPVPPAAARSVLAGAGLAMLLVLAAAAALAGGAVIVAHTEVTATGHAVATTTSGAAGLVLLDLLAAPLAALDVAALLLGSGFGLGAGTHIGLTSVVLGPTPALPLLAAIPAAGALPPWLLLLLLAPVGAGAVGAQRAMRGVHHPGQLLSRCVAVGIIAAALAAMLAFLADGPAGPGRLMVTGPSPWRTALAALVTVGGGALAIGSVRALHAYRSRSAR
ncbi:MAG TPA: DUF6350 family protein [Mycobacteriales bacterium]|nr:DUF6350 family protein [Mycobacteriales bacterium]